MMLAPAIGELQKLACLLEAGGSPQCWVKYRVLCRARGKA